MDIHLVQIGEYGGRDAIVDGPEFVIGREITCGLKLDHGKVSNRHCRLFWRGSRLMVEDLNSAHGTAVNDQNLGTDPVELNHGDRLRVGPVNFQVLFKSEQDKLDAGAGEMSASRFGAALDDFSPAGESARQLLDRLRGHDTTTTASARPVRRDLGGGRRAKLEVAVSSGVAVAKIVAKSIVEEADIRKIAQELDELIDAGRNRIALNFGHVEHLSSQAIGALLEAHRRCKAEGGDLKICEVNPLVAEVFSMTNLGQHVEIFPEQAPALASEWPEPAKVGKSPASARQAAARFAPKGAKHVRLIVGVGRAKGQAVEVFGQRFVIGRDARCQLRPNSESISRIHASIEQRDGRVFVRDFGTVNGTLLGDLLLRGQEAEARDGDTLQVGALRFTMSIEEPAAREKPEAEEDALSWLLEEHATDSSAATAFLPSIPALGTAAEAPPRSARPAISGTTTTLRTKVEGDVLVLSVLSTELTGEDTVSPFRHDLHAVLDPAQQSKVVIDLERVRSLSPRAVGVILACDQGRRRTGGVIRVCCVRPELLPVLVQMRLTQVIDVHPSLDSALRADWE